jgi:hypothetical protein
MHDSIDTEARAWNGAQTFEELVLLGGRFVAGELGSFPGWAAEALDVESIPIRSRLVAFHRAGFLTVASQPGVAAAPEHDGRTRAQRAFVCGFVSAATAHALATLAREADLHVGVFEHGAARGTEYPVSTRGGEAYAFAGYNAFDEELECFSERCSAAALAALRQTRYVSLVDLAWGRHDHLFDRVARALESA